MIKRVRNLILRNWGLKLLSLLLAFVLWLSLIPEEKSFSEKTLTIPLEPLNIPSGIELVEKPDPTVDVTIRAPNRMINAISAANVFAKLNLSAASVIQREYPLNETMISIPPGAEVVRISPTKVGLRFERTEQVMLNVVPAIIGQTKQGYGVSQIVITPPRVLVQGPESKVREKDNVSTSPINISELTATTEVEADLILPKPELRLASPQTRVRVRILVEEIKTPGKPESKSKK
jgi:YbbR domain-containing protein